MPATYETSIADPFDRGEDMGRHLAEQIGATVSGYEDLFAAAAGRPVDLDELGGEALERVRDWWPAGAAEIEGMAAGSGIDASRIAALNARTEILAACADRPSRGECSTFLSLGQAPGGSFAAQTWDWHEHLAESWFVLTVDEPEGASFHTLTEYGILGKIGLNSAGVAVLLNILHHAGDGDGIGVPIHVIARRILQEASNLNGALALATNATVSASSALTIVGHDDEEISGVCLELFPGGPGVLVADERGTFVRTNHFLSPGAARSDREPQIGPDTFLRFDVLRRRLAGRRPSSAPECRSLLCSHYGGGGALCAHPDEGAPVGERYATLATAVFDFGADEMTVTPGGPCSDTEPGRFSIQQAESTRSSQ